MARTRCRPNPTRAQTLTPVITHCPECGHFLWTTHSWTANRSTKSPIGSATNPPRRE
jgi:hypothetical protein